MTQDDILKALSNVQEPDLCKDLISIFYNRINHASLSYERADEKCFCKCH